MSCNPAQFGVELARSSFADYYRYHSLPAQNHWLEMGYARQGCPAEREVTRFFCRHFCERFKLGWASHHVRCPRSVMEVARVPGARQNSAAWKLSSVRMRATSNQDLRIGSGMT
jgi:hypothetical protein